MTAVDSTLRIEPLSKAIGARILGVDLAEAQPDHVVAEIRSAFLEYSVLCFPGQRIEPDDQVRFAGYFGNADAGDKPRSRGAAPTRERTKGIMLVTNIRENGEPIGSLPDGEMHFHSDGAHSAVPYRATTLYAVTLPSHGGETKFANLYSAYEALPAAVKDRIAGKKALFAHQTSATLREQVEDIESPRVSFAEHNLVCEHPETGRKSLYISRLMTQYILDMDRDQSRSLLDELIDHAERPEFVYEHTWDVGDLIIWDNRCVNHARNDFPEDQVRLLRRVTVSEPD